MNLNNLRNRVSIVSLVLLYLTFVAMSYFGSINPIGIGLISGFAITAAFFSIGLLLSSRYTWLYVIYLLATFIFFNVVIFTNWWHFQYFGAFYNYESLNFGGSALDGLKSIDAFEYRGQTELLLLVSGICIGLHLVLFRKSDYDKNWSLITAIACIVFSIYGFSQVSALTDELKQRNAFLLSPKYLHPAHAFFTSVSSKRDIKKLNSSWNTFKEYNALVPNSSPTLIPVKTGDDSEVQYNVITIVIESFRASMIGHYGSNLNITPNFDKIAQETISARNFYANSNYTVKGETSIFCGIFDHNIQIPIAEYPQDKKLNCLPSILSDKGYATYYFHGNRGKFYNRYEYLPQVGFKNLYFHADTIEEEQDERNYIGWGVSDVDMFTIMQDKLETTEQPFLANMMSLTNHYPFNHELPIAAPYPFTKSNLDGFTDDELFNNYKNTIFYTDYALGKFWERFKKSGLTKNTIVVITADHGIWSFPEEKQTDSSAVLNEEFFRIPLLIYHPNNTHAMELDAISSQVDILPSLSSLLDVEIDRDHYIGKDIFSMVENPWSVMTKSGQVFVRQKDYLCHQAEGSCKGAHQVCMAITHYDVPLAGQKCEKVIGDPLNGGSFGETVMAQNLLSGAHQMIGLENYRVFENGAEIATTQPIHKTNREIRLEAEKEKRATLK